MVIFELRAAVAFLLYAWRAVLLELSNWRNVAFAVVGFVGYFFKLVLAVIFHFIGAPITSMISSCYGRGYCSELR
ncbi:hypothetical protein V6N13_089516 [Hibiscus sabdariffa]